MMKTNLLGLAAILLLGTLATGQSTNSQKKPSKEAQQKVRVPDVGSRRTMTAEVREIFKGDYAKTDPDSRRALGEKLLKQATATKRDPVSRFVLLMEAQDIAGEGGDARTAFTAIEAIFRDYLGMWVTRSRMELDVLEQTRALAKTPDAKRAVARLYLQTAQRAATATHFFTALKAAQTAEAIAREISDHGLKNTAAALSKTVPKARSEFDLARRAKAALSRNPDDRDANLSMGQFLCFSKWDWKSGLPYLIKGAQGELLRVAKSELTPPKSPTEQLALGDSWAALFDKEDDPRTKDHYSTRARTWYEKALAGAEGFVRLRIAKRLEKLPLSKEPIDLLALIDPKRDAAFGTWLSSGEGLTYTTDHARLQIPYKPPEEYDLILLIERTKGNEGFGLGLLLDNTQFQVWFDGHGSTVSGIHNLDGMTSDRNELAWRKGQLLRTNTSSKVVCSVRQSGFSVKVDGKRIIRWRGHPSRLSLDPPQQIADTRALFISGTSAKFRIHQLALVNHSAFRKVNLADFDRPTGPDGLVGCWKFDERRGLDLEDSSGQGNKGKIRKFVGWTRGRFGAGLAFDPAQKTYASVGASGWPASNAPHTLSWWFFYSAKPAPTVKDKDIDLMIHIFKPRIGSTSIGFAQSKLGVWKSRGGGPFHVSATMPRVNVWHHCAYTFDGREHKLYVDGKAKASSRAAPEAFRPNTVQFGRSALGYRHFSGSLDEVRIYNRALAASEIKALAEGAD